MNGTNGRREDERDRRRIRAVDVDGDGKPDVVTMRRDSSGTYTSGGTSDVPATRDQSGPSALPEDEGSGDDGSGEAEYVEAEWRDVPDGEESDGGSESPDDGGSRAGDVAGKAGAAAKMIAGKAKAAATGEAAEKARAGTARAAKAAGQAAKTSGKAAVAGGKVAGEAAVKAAKSSMEPREEGGAAGARWEPAAVGFSDPGYGHTQSGPTPEETMGAGAGIDDGIVGVGFTGGEGSWGGGDSDDMAELGFGSWGNDDGAGSWGGDDADDMAELGFGFYGDEPDDDRPAGTDDFGFGGTGNDDWGWL